MAVKILADKAGQLQGLDANTVARLTYGGSAHYMEDPTGETWEGYVGAFVRHSPGRPQGEYDVLDLIVELHDIHPR
ncbi:hypothetical protein MYRNA_61 [Mycobacterium phage Myrna]|uniref:Uncharacterized protein n=1 Tax=Mycobacterium phage Myrna TaxID=546805 RepID=B5LJ72_9CAUD|nr:gp61 [Mycobacterium phage Myrna]ACH62069.1 hypothetical protein MYRNA_61 [Mycobacterium phage Myrna]